MNKKVFCLYYSYGRSHSLLSFCKMGENVFTTSGFNNWKKALELQKFRSHESSHTHREAKRK